MVMDLVEKTLDISSRLLYTHKVNTNLDETIMFYDDYDLDYNTSYDYSYDLDEMCEHHNASYNMQDTYDLDEDYARDTCDYDTLAYRHYA